MMPRSLAGGLLTAQGRRTLSQVAGSRQERALSLARAGCRRDRLRLRGGAAAQNLGVWEGEGEDVAEACAREQLVWLLACWAAGSLRWERQEFVIVDLGDRGVYGACEDS